MVLAEWDTRSQLTLIEYDWSFRRSALWQRVDSLERDAKGFVKRAEIGGNFIVSEYQYYAVGRLSRWIPTKEQFGLAHNNPVSIAYEYYPSGDVKRRIAPRGTQVEIRYDAKTGWPESFRLLPAADDPRQEELILRKELVYDPEGFLVSYRDARGELHRWEKDALGRPHAYVRPDGVREETFYDGLDRPIHYRWGNSDGKILGKKKLEYDLRGRLSKVQVHRSGAYLSPHKLPPIDEWLVAQQTRYDPEGCPVERRLYREEAWVKTEHDGLGRLVRTIAPEGDCTEIYYDGDYPVVETYRRRSSSPS